MAFVGSGLLHELVISVPVKAGFVLSLPILFHGPFLAGVVWPLLGPGP